MKEGMIMRKADERRAKQLAFEGGSENIIVGDPGGLPVPAGELASLKADSPLCGMCIDGGFTSEVFKLTIGGRHFALKKKRDISKVLNIDGRTSFLNEVQRRRDFSALKHSDPVGFANVIDTVYADFRKGIILSPWIEGEEISHYNGKIFDSIYRTLCAMHLAGIFEYDLCSGNLLLQSDGEILLYDFGYCYTFDPLHEYNPDGTDLPIFHPAERLETRTFFVHLDDLGAFRSPDLALQLYRLEKTVALKHYRLLADELRIRGASAEVNGWFAGIIRQWETGLADYDSLVRLFRLEKFRSFLLDVHDDISGRCCNPDTLMKIEVCISTLKDEYEFLKDNNGLFWGDELLSKEELLNAFAHHREAVQRYMGSDTAGYEQWKVMRKKNIERWYPA